MLTWLRMGAQKKRDVEAAEATDGDAEEEAPKKKVPLATHRA